MRSNAATCINQKILVRKGDHVKKGQLLAKLDDSVLIPQVNRLAASLEQTRAQAALSAAEYRRAQAVAPATAAATPAPPH